MPNVPLKAIALYTHEAFAVKDCQTTCRAVKCETIIENMTQKSQYEKAT